jgi:hypothetical protein
MMSLVSILRVSGRPNDSESPGKGKEKRLFLTWEETGVKIKRSVRLEAIHWVTIPFWQRKYTRRLPERGKS